MSYELTVALDHFFPDGSFCICTFKLGREPLVILLWLEII